MTDTNSFTPLTLGGILDRADDFGGKYFADESGLLVQGDCMEVMDALIVYGVEFDAIICDPPWMSPAAAVVDDQVGGKKQGRIWGDMSILGMAFNNCFSRFRRLQKQGGATCIFCGDISGAVFAPLLYPRWQRMQLLTWDKSAGSHRGRVLPPFLYKTEFIWYCADGIGNPANGMSRRGETTSPILRFTATPPSSRIHQSEKPVALLEHLINLTTPPGGLVADFFAGSFSLQRAAQNTGRRYLCVEMDETFFARAVDARRRGGAQKRIV